MKPMRILVAALSITWAISPASAEKTRTAEMYKSQQCACCDEYAKYLEQNGFKVKIESLPDEQFELIKRMAVIPERLKGCHTLKISGYVVEGLVPVSAIDKLLNEKPDIRGISLPGMHPAAPGMWGRKTAPLIVYEIPQSSTETPKEFARE